MVFPESKRIVFAKNPLVGVICQLRFPSILEIPSREPVNFQNFIRATYPVYEKETGLPEELRAALAQLPLSSLFPEGVTHKFLTEDRTCQIALTRDFVSITTTRYRNWAEFRKEVLLAKESLEKSYSPSFYSRIGLRYQDVINRTDLGLVNEPWNVLLRSSITGLLAEEEIGSQVVAQQNQTLVRLNEVAGFAMLRFGLKPGQGSEQTYEIDADLYSEEKRSTTDVISALDGFNRLAGNFFRWAIRDRLRNALGSGAD
jgi:uncharacterized protein (TIGR04255 family)